MNEKIELARSVLADVTTNTLTRAQMEEFAKKTGRGMWFITDLNKKVGRGVYAIKEEFLNLRSMHVISENTTVVADVKEQSQEISITVPPRDDNFVNFGVFSQVNTVIASKQFFPIYVTGPTGNGKSTAVKQACAVNNRGFIRVNMNAQTDEEMLIGSKTIKNGNVEIVDGPVIIAMRTGSVLLIDEIDAGNPNTILALQAVLEGGSYYYKLKNEWVTPAPGFNIIATANTKGRGAQFGLDYVGTTVLNEAFLERFAITLEQDYPSNAMELRILKKHASDIGLDDDEFLKTLVTWSDTIHATHKNGAVSDIVTTRRLLHILRAYKMFGDKEQALKFCLSRFEAVTKDAFLDLYNKLNTGSVVAASTATSALENN